MDENFIVVLTVFFSKCVSIFEWENNNKVVYR
jgi:hypothetical protein